MSHLSTLKLNMLRYGELDADQEADARRHLAACEPCADRLRAQEANRAAFVLQPVPAPIKQAAASRRPRWAWWTLLLPALAAALALVALRPWEAGPVAPATVEADTRDKGAAILLEAWLDDSRGPRLLEDGAAVHAGDKVQLRFSAGAHPLVTLAGVDGSGDVEIYATLRAEPGARVQQAPFGLTLDNTPGDQEFVALFTGSKPTPELVRRVLLDGRPVPDGTLRRVHLRKK